jgi:hypothetical protein
VIREETLDRSVVHHECAVDAAGVYLIERVEKAVWQTASTLLSSGSSR